MLLLLLGAWQENGCVGVAWSRDIALSGHMGPLLRLRVQHIQIIKDVASAWIETSEDVDLEPNSHSRVATASRERVACGLELCPELGV